MKIMLKIYALALGVTGCGFEGPSPIVSATGLPGQTIGGSTELFRKAFDESYKSALTSTPDPKLAANMVKIGAELQYQLCRDFFRGAGKEQQWLLFGKDFLAVAGTITTGVLGAVSVAAGGVGNATAIAWVGLGTAAGVSGINLYARNFLFSEDNVGAVSTLTLEALNAARQTALSEERMAAYDFSSAISTLIDIQSQCEVQNILNLVRKSLGVARPYAVPDFATAVGGVAVAKVSELVNGGFPVTSDQLRDLYWLLMLAPTENETIALRKKLSALKTPPTGNSNDAFSGRTEDVKQALRGLPASLIDEFVKSVQKAREPAPSGAPAAAPLRLMPLPPLPKSSPLGRIRIDVK